MTTVSEREKIQNVVRSFPAEASIEDAIERLYLLYKVEKGIQQADAGQTVSHQEATAKMARLTWTCPPFVATWAAKK